VVRDRAELISALAGDLEVSEVVVERPPRVIFVFPDGDLRELAPHARALCVLGEFRAVYDECARATPGALSEVAAGIAIQIALARTWRAWGVEPSGVHGAGSGAHAAAAVAGTLSLGDALARVDCPDSPGPDAQIPGGAIALELGAGARPGASGASGSWVAALAGASAHGAGRAMIETAAQLWRLGVAIDPAGLYRGECRRRIPLPTFPFDGARHGWVVTAGRR
jgi:polyketide synthase PksN